MDRAGILVRRFLALKYTQRLQVARDLGLQVEGDGNLGGPALEFKYIERAASRGQQKELWDAVEAAHGDGKHPTNPYAFVEQGAGI